MNLAVLLLSTWLAQDGIPLEEKLLVKLPADATIEKVEFSPDGKTVAYTGRTEGRWFAGIGDQKVADLDLAAPPVFSGDGKRCGLAAQKNGKWILLIDGKQEGAAHDALMGPVFRPSDNVPAYAAIDDGEATVFVGQEKVATYKDVGGLPVFSRDGTHCAFVGIREKRWFVVADGKELESFDKILKPAFSADGKRLAYSAKKDGKWFLVVDGKKQEGEFDDLGFPTWSSTGTLAVSACRKKAWFAVIGDTKGPEYDRVAQPAFSADGKHVAYPAFEGKEAFIVVDGKPGKRHPFAALPTFSPDGTTVAYLVLDKLKMSVVVGDQQSEPFDSVGVPCFSGDGKSVGFGARKDHELWWKVLKIQAR